MTRVLVTGAAGFIGTWLVPELQSAGYDVVGVDRVDGDISLPGVFERLAEIHKPDIVVHLAAKAGVIWCEENPAEAIQNNALATLYVAKECQRHGARLVFASSSEVYGDQLVGLEDGPVYPKTIYGTIKVMEEHICKLYAARPPLILRISMPYGPFWETLTSIRKIRHRGAIINFLWQGLHGLSMPVHKGTHR
jgi:nucleoside-diphosphate-sugar epimerase